MRRCSKCHENKELTEFYACKTRKDRLYAHCKTCHGVLTLAHRTKYPDARRNLGYLQRFGITIEQYDLLHANQNGLCALCGQPETRRWRGKPTRLAVDHNHLTGEVRGLCCFVCNARLHALDNEAWFRTAMSYLASPPAREVLYGRDDS